MRTLMACGLILSLSAGLTGCGQSEEERKVEEAQQAAEAAAEDMAKGLEGLARAMEGAAGGGETAPVDPVSFRDLETTLPAVAGWERETPRGERMTSPIPFSQSETSYARDDARVDVKVVDSGFNQLLMAPWAMFLAAGYERETSEGFERSLEIDGHPGFERWTAGDRSGELNLVVAKRFLVTIEGRDIDDPKVLHEFARALDLGKLRGMK